MIKVKTTANYGFVGTQMEFEEETEVEAIPAELILHEKGWSE